MPRLTVVAAVLIGAFTVLMLILFRATGGDTGRLLFWLAVFLVASLTPAAFGELLGGTRDVGSQAGFLLGFLLSWAGIILLLCMPDQGKTRTCPHCAERVRVEARVCRWCHQPLR